MPELKSLLMLLVITAVGAGATLYLKNKIYTLPQVEDTVLVQSSSPASDNPTTTDSTVPVKPAPTSPKPPVANPPQGIAPSLIGTLTAVDTGCFSDGVCFATVGGKKVVLLVGRYQGALGKIIGAESIGDLESHIGEQATVFAGQDTEGNFTLLGNEMFYLKVASSSKPIVGACVVGGCSSQLCGEEADMDGMVTSCEYQTKYSCYQRTTCARQATGKCAWTETPELLSCLKDSAN